MICLVVFLFFGFICGSIYGVKGSAQLPISENKDGQCPYILDAFEKNCDFQCKSDSSCQKKEKCCSNGCGTKCMEPLVHTKCEHDRLVTQNHVDKSTTKSTFIPQCTEDGRYEDKQCDVAKNECWCVDFRGFEISQTRTLLSNRLECSEKPYSGNCPLYKCAKDCEHGFKLDQNGCRTCSCIDPCESIDCSQTGHSCRLLKVKSTDWHCPPVPLCLPHPSNPCLYGEPLNVDNSTVVCNGEKSCPFTHMCRSSVFSTQGSCCPQKGKCPPFKCNLSCPYGYSYDINECPICECYEPCKKVQCDPPKVCIVQQVQCFRAPCPPIGFCE